MGNQRSKLQNPSIDVHETPSTPERAVTPNAHFSNDEKSEHIMALIDPRSPTVEISRTPITVEEERARREKLLKMMLRVNNGQDLQKTPTTCEDFYGDFDPRSPTYSIQRTPILLDNADEVDDYIISGDNSLSQFTYEKPSAKRDLDTAANTGQLCKDLRKRLFISQRLNMSDNELLSSSTGENDEENKEN